MAKSIYLSLAPSQGLYAAPLGCFVSFFIFQIFDFFPSLLSRHPGAFRTNPHVAGWSIITPSGATMRRLIIPGLLPGGGEVFISDMSHPGGREKRVV